MPTVVSYGGGINSTAMIIAMQKTGMQIDAVLFADTGGEKDDTYDYVIGFRQWCVDRGVPFTVVSFSGSPASRLKADFLGTSKHASLEDECHNNGTLPSKAFGFGGCSFKWKRMPMDAWVKQWEPAVECWKLGGKVTRCIGIHAGETKRGKIPDDELFTYRFPLKEMCVGQSECVAIIRAEGLRVPGKSACFFCPSMKKQEVIELGVLRPDLAKRAVEMEQNAKECDGLQVIKGLGRHWSWEELLQQDQRQMKLFDDLQAPMCDTCIDW